MLNETGGEWRDVPGYDGIYRIDKSGVVYSVKREWQISPFVPKCGYWSVNLSDANGSRTCAQVHRLLALSFIDGMTSKDRVRFKNGNKLDYRLENLFITPRVEKVVVPPKSLEERFWENVKVCSFLDCWSWLGCKNNAGYGSLSDGSGSRSIMAHRASWLIHFGEIPEITPRLVVMHKCDNPSCVNPAHLELGTHKDNTQDAMRKGRFRPSEWSIGRPKGINGYQFPTLRANRTSTYRGVSYMKGKKTGCWLVQIRAEGEGCKLGTYREEVFAAKVYDAAARFYFGKTALTNFDGELALPVDEIRRLRYEGGIFAVIC